MAERWQRELSKIRRVELGDDLWDRIVEGPRLEPVRERSRSRPLAAAVAFAVFAAAGLFVWSSFSRLAPSPGTLAGSNVVEVPAPGEVTTAFLADGHPVFVEQLSGGGLVVLDAFSPRRPFGIRELAVWCTGKPYFMTWPDGSFFDRTGGWTGGISAQPGLAAYAFEVVARDADGDPSRLRIGRIGPPVPHQHGNLFNRRAYPSGCGLAEGSSATVLEHEIPPSRVWGSPLALVRAEPDGWVAVRGALAVGEDGSIRLCAEGSGSCADGARVAGLNARALGHELEIHPASRFGQPHLWLAMVRDGTIVDLALADHL